MNWDEVKYFEDEQHKPPNISYGYSTVTWEEIEVRYCRNCRWHSCDSCVYRHHTPSYNTTSLSMPIGMEGK